MKVLFTSTRSRKGVHASEAALRDSDSGTVALLDALSGEKYDIRPVDVGECLDEYDVIVVTLTNALVQGNDDLYGAIWACLQDWTGGPRVLVNFDHFTIREIVKSFTGFQKHPEKLFDGFIEYKKPERARTYGMILMDQINRWAHGYWQHTITCKHTWGDPKLLVKGLDGILDGITYTYDPSFLHLDIASKAMGPGYVFPPREARRRRWVFGGIADHDRWIDKQRITWPIEKYGIPRMGRPLLNRNNLLKIYPTLWGGISPPYYNVGSGYWRARHVHYAMGDLINLCDPREIPSEHFTPTAEIIEQLSTNDLADLAFQQHLTIMNSIRDPEDTVCEIFDIFERMANLPREHSVPRPSFMPPDPMPTRLV